MNHSTLPKVFISTILVSMIVLAFFPFIIKPVRSATTTYRGLSWYGLGTGDFAYWHLTNVYPYYYVNTMFSRYPNMTVLVLGMEGNAYMGSSAIRARLADFVSWCSSHNCKLVISDYRTDYHYGASLAFWQSVASTYYGNTTILGFDLQNEPWLRPHCVDNDTMIYDYCNLTKAIRDIDSARKVFIQDIGEQWRGFNYRNWITNMEGNLSDRGLTNVEYMFHIYAHDFDETAAWETATYVYPWLVGYHLEGNYTHGYIDLLADLESDCLQYIDSKGIKIFFDETSTKDDAPSRRFWSDLITIIENHGCDWCYHAYYSGEVRPMCLTYNNVTATERGHAALVKSKMPGNETPPPPFTSWSNGFEEGDFSKWNETQTSNGTASVVTSPVYAETYAANFTTTGASVSYARVYHDIEYITCTALWTLAYVRMEDLPDSSSTSFYLFRMADASGNFIAYCGVHRNASDAYHWMLSVDDTGNGEYTNYTYDATISADAWYCIEMYFNRTEANATLFVNGDKKCYITGIFSGLAYVQRVYAMCYVYGTQLAAKTIYWDNYAVDDSRIYPNSTKGVFRGYAKSIGGTVTPLENVTINGTFTDSAGWFSWSGLTYNSIYCFVVSPPTGYYPAWITNVYGNFYWNGTHYIVLHNVTESQMEDYIEIFFSEEVGLYINQTSTLSKISNVEVELGTDLGDEYSFNIVTASWIAICTDGYADEPLYSGATAETYDPITKIANYTISSGTLALLFSETAPLSVTLYTPTNGYIAHYVPIVFSYIPRCSGSFTGSALWTNYTGTWDLLISNTTAIVNNTVNTFAASFTGVPITIVWNVEVYSATFGAFSVSNYTLHIQYQSSLTVTLFTPTDGSLSSQYNQTFAYTPVSNMTFTSAALWTNTTGVWAETAANSSVVSNNTLNSISYTFPSYNTILWNIKVTDVTYNVQSGLANYTLTLGIPQWTVYGSGFSIANVTAICFSYDDEIYVTINSTTELNGTDCYLAFNDTYGLFTFTNNVQSDITLTYGVTALYVNDNPVSNGTTVVFPTGGSKIEWGNVAFPSVEIQLPIPIIFIFGMVGLGCMLTGPIYGINKITKKEYRDGFIWGTIITCVGFALFISWLYGGVF